MLFSVFMSFSAVDLVKKNKEQRTAAVVGLKRLKLFFFGQQHSKFSNLVSDDFFFFCELRPFLLSLITFASVSVFYKNPQAL
jgi:hypothetical protein